MTQFKAGDKFIPRKPKENTTLLVWLPEMDIYDGVTLEVSDINVGYLKARESAWLFHPDWCEKVEEESVKFVQRECDATSIEAPLSTSLTFTHGGIRYQERVPEVGKTIDWEQRRYELAKEVMLVDVSNCFTKGKFSDIAEAVKYAIICADEMIKQLKQE